MSRRLLFKVASVAPSRFLSTSSVVSNASVVETASNVAKQASEKLASSGATAKAKQAVASIISAASAATANGSQRLGNLQPVVEKVTYVSKVGMEIAKEVFRREKMSPPSLAQYEAAKSEFRSLYAKYAHPDFIQKFNWREITVEQIVSKGFLTLEIGTFFLIGEIIGRRNLIGYDVPTSKSSHH